MVQKTIDCMLAFKIKLAPISLLNSKKNRFNRKYCVENVKKIEKKTVYCFLKVLFARNFNENLYSFFKLKYKIFKKLR